MGGGLVVIVEISGAKRFEARIRRVGDRNPRRVTIGSFPATSVAEARAKLQAAKSIAKDGRDPALEHRRERAGVVALRTLNDLIQEYLSRREGDVAKKTHKIEKDLLDGVLSPVLGDRLLSDLEPQDFGRAVSDYAARLRGEGRSQGTNANKLLASARRMFKTARGWGVIGAVDPTVGLSKPAKEAPRDRVLFDGKVLVGPQPKSNEIGKLIDALEADPSPVPVSASTRTALRLTLMLGLRALEACSLRWESIALEGDPPTLTVTTSKTDAGLRDLPLPARAVEMLRELKKTAAKGAIFLFPAEEKAKRVAHMHPESLSRAFARACERLGIADASTHDLRRTCLSALNELGHEGVSERIAGHVPRSVMGRHYDRSVRMNAMRLALEAWAHAIDDAATRFRAASQNAKAKLEEAADA